MNWGWKITLVYIGFVAMILTLVFKARSEKIDLVATDYYAQEVAYQQRIDAIERAKSLSAPVSIQYGDARVTIQLPAECAGKASGDVTLYRPSDASLDATHPLTIDATGLQHIDGSTLKNGYYIVQVKWTMDNNAYYSEQSIFVP